MKIKIKVSIAYAVRRDKFKLNKIVSLRAIGSSSPYLKFLLFSLGLNKIQSWLAGST